MRTTKDMTHNYFLLVFLLLLLLLLPLLQIRIWINIYTVACFNQPILCSRAFGELWNYLKIKITSTKNRKMRTRSFSRKHDKSKEQRAKKKKNSFWKMTHIKANKMSSMNSTELCNRVENLDKWPVDLKKIRIAATCTHALTYFSFSFLRTFSPLFIFWWFRVKCDCNRWLISNQSL